MKPAPKLLFFLLISFCLSLFASLPPAYADWTLDFAPPTTSFFPFSAGNGCTTNQNTQTTTCPTSAIVTLSFSCDDGSGSGCLSIYYGKSSDGPWTLYNIPIPGSQPPTTTSAGGTPQVWYAKSVDRSGNQENPPKSHTIIFSSTVVGYKTCRNDGTNYSGYCRDNPPAGVTPQWLYSNGSQTTTAPSCSGTLQYASNATGNSDCGSGWYCYSCITTGGGGGGGASGGTFGKSSPNNGAQVIASAGTTFQWSSYTPPTGQPAGAYKLVVCAGAQSCGYGVVNQCTTATSYSVPANTLNNGTTYYWQVYWGPNADCSGPIAYYSKDGWKMLATLDPINVILNEVKDLKL